MRLVEENSTLIEHREKEIQSIVQSISELNEIFRDLATMIVEQVTKEYYLSFTGFVRVMENLKSHKILEFYFTGMEGLVF